MKRLIGLILGACLAPTLWAQGKDGLWEITSKVEMPGMPAEMKGMKIPGFGEANKQTVCLKEGQKHEDEHQKECKVTNSSQTGKVYRATLVCKEMTMKMEHEQVSRDHWRSKMETSGGKRDEAMTIASEGKRVGTCDSAKEGGMSRETQKVVDDANQNAAAQAAEIGKACKAAEGKWPAEAHAISGYDQYMKQRADTLGRMKGSKSKDGSKLIEGQFPDAPGCAAAKAEYCAKSKNTAGEMATRKGYSAVLKRLDDSNVRSALSACGSDFASLTAKHCKAAVNEADYVFVAESCPVERVALGKQYCAGRAYTAVEPKYRALCGGGGESDVAEEKASVEKAPSTKEVGAEAVEQGMKKLKGLLGF